MLISIKMETAHCLCSQ